MMLYFVIARHHDARPIIDYYGLKKDMTGGPFTIFTAHNIVLCLSDKGRANAAAATAYMLSRWGRDGLFVHLGLLGALDSSESLVSSGSLESLESLVRDEGVFYPHTIFDGKEVVYQEMLYKPPLIIQEGTLEDGEGLYAFLSAARFLPLKQIIVLRSNHLANEGVLSWLETICGALSPFGTMSFPTSMLKKAQGITP